MPHAGRMARFRLDDGNRAQHIREAKCRGEPRRHHAGPTSGANVRIEQNHGIGLERGPWITAGVAQEPFDDATILHIRREQAEGNFGDLRPRYSLTVAKRCVRRREQPIALAIKRHGGDATERFVVDIGEACIDLEIFQ